MKEKIIIGIDPGLDGGFAVIGNLTHIVPTIRAMPIITTTKGKRTMRTLDLSVIVGRMLAWVAPCEEVMVFIEKVHAMPKQGVSSSFKFGQGYGQLQGICAALGIGYQLVTPQAWMKSILAGYSSQGKTKASVEYVKAKYPILSLLATERSRKPHDGMADALCIAEYGWRLEGGALP